MEAIRVGYNKALGAVILLVAGTCAALALTTGGPFWLLGISIAAALVGALYLFRPFLIVTDSAIRAKSLIGYDVRRFNHGGLGTLEVIGSTILLGTGEKRQRLRLPGAMLSRRDLQTLAKIVEAAKTERALPDEDPGA